MKQAPLRVRHWTRVEYERLVDLGVFEGEPLELLGGQLVVAEPHGVYHASAISALEYAVESGVAAGMARADAAADLARRRVGAESRISWWFPDVPVTIARRIPIGRFSSSKWPNRASRSIATTRVASMRAPEFRTTGS
jgi:hypothetical protein